MAKSETTAKRSGHVVLQNSRSADEKAKTPAASVVAQRPAKASARSERVIKDVSQEHRDALKRLVDR